MYIAFVTFGNITQHATLKRATGMAKPLMAAGHRVAILLEETEDNVARVALECPDVEIHYLHRNGAWHDLRERQKVINAIKPDVVWVCGPGFRNFVTGVKGRSDAITIADHSELLSGIPSRPKFRRLYDYMTEVVFAFAFKEHVVSSRYLERIYGQRLKRFGRKVKPLYFPYAYNRSILEDEPATIVDSLRDQHLGQKVAVYLGTFTENYGIFDMIEAAERVSKENADFRLILMGQGREKERALEMIKERGLEEVVLFPGFVAEEDLSSYFSIADTFICPLRDTVQDWARCPSKLFLFLPYAKPVVTCKIGEAAEIFGDDGYYYEPRNIDSMVQALCAAIRGQDTRRPVDRSLHDWDERVRVFLNWLQETHPDVLKDNGTYVSNRIQGS